LTTIENESRLVKYCSITQRTHCSEAIVRLMMGILEKKLKNLNYRCRRVLFGLAAPSREEHGNPAKNTFDTLWGHYCDAFCRPPIFFGQRADCERAFQDGASQERPTEVTLPWGAGDHVGFPVGCFRSCRISCRSRR
jgi:hypothetical protein